MKPKLTRSATIFVGAFNIPVMVGLGILIGFFLSKDLQSPMKEAVIIFFTILFFIMAFIELYLGISRAEKRQQANNLKNESLKQWLYKEVITDNNQSDKSNTNEH